MTLAARTVLIQIIIGLFVIIITDIVMPSLLFSVAAGIIVMWCALSYLIYKVWRLELGRHLQPQKITKILYMAQAVKFIVLILGVVLVIWLFTVNWFAFLIGVIVVQIGNIFTSIQIKKVITS